MSDSPTTVLEANYQAMNTRDLSVFDRLYAPDVTLNGEPASPAAIRGYCTAYLDAFQDLELTVERIVTDGEWAAARVVARGTHTAALGDLDATGNRIEVAQHDLVRVSGGRIVECHTVFDQFAMLQQLEAIPA